MIFVFYVHSSLGAFAQIAILCDQYFWLAFVFNLFGPTELLLARFRMNSFHRGIHKVFGGQMRLEKSLKLQRDRLVLIQQKWGVWWLKSSCWVISWLENSYLFVWTGLELRLKRPQLHVVVPRSCRSIVRIVSRWLSFLRIVLLFLLCLAVLRRRWLASASSIWCVSFLWRWSPL